MLQVLAYTQKARESYNEEQISLCERMLEYKKHVNHESMLSLNGPYDSPCRDGQVQHEEERSFYALERLWRDCPTIELPEAVTSGRGE